MDEDWMLQDCDFTWKAADRAGPYPKVVWMFFTRDGLLQRKQYKHIQFSTETSHTVTGLLNRLILH